MSRKVVVEGGINAKGWLLLSISIVVSLIFTLIHPNEIIYLFGILGLGAFFGVLVQSIGVTSKNIVEVPNNVDFLDSVKEVAEKPEE
jgi:hypothetical protein